jgi:ubiquinone/menaquinone biosynthesis C-methylase UbiE
MKKTQDFFDQLADTWEDQSFPQDARKRVSELVVAFGIKKGARVLDVGTGTGILHPYLLEAVGNSGQVFAFDYSFKMLKEAKQKPSKLNLLCLQASAMAVPLPNNLFDYIICFAAFPHFSNKFKALKEMARVAQKGAEVFIAHLMSRDELLKHHGNHSPVAGDTVPEAADMRRMCRSAGLTDPQITDKPGFYLARALKA